MRFLQPAVTCILTAHMKPYLRDSLVSLLAQTRQHDVQVLVVDSGQWLGRDDETSRAMAAVHADFAGHPMFEWVFTGEPADLRNRLCPVAWATNEVIRAGLVRGRYVCTFYDDDRYHPTFMQEMAGFLDTHLDAGAVWCSQNRIRLDRDGSETLIGVIAATGPKNGNWDCQVDGGQIMFRRTVLEAIGDPWLPEDPADGSCRHSDGIFLEKLGAVCGTVPAIGEVLMDHRFSPISTYTPSTS
jgi:hypothetical protein